MGAQELSFLVRQFVEFFSEFAAFRRSRVIERIYMPSHRISNAFLLRRGE
ncbi:MAG: hypothetical protein HYX29_04865 [Solirubrobacterales bacterium]|nr:hypothetical protein [Solirubrobacterales bacterium]